MAPAQWKGSDEMASRVNIKFVVILGVVLLAVVGGIAAVGYQAIKKSGDDYVKLGDEANAKGDIEKAIEWYSRAVNKDQRNTAWIQKWIDAMEKSTPSTRVKYADRYNGQYRLLALRALMDSDKSNVQYAVRLLKENQLLVSRQPAPRLADFEFMSKLSDEVLKNYQGDEKSKGLIRRYRGLAAVGIVSVSPEPKAEVCVAGLADLDASLVADPADEEATLAASQLELQLAELSRKRDDKPEVEKYQQATRTRLEKFKAAYPPATVVSYRLLLLDMQSAAQAFRDGKDPKAPKSEQEAVAKLIKMRQDRVTEILAALDDTAIAKLDPQAALGIAGVIVEALPDGKKSSMEFLQRVRASHPKDVGLLLLGMGRLSMGTGDTASAEARFKELLETPNLPLSAQGLVLNDNRAQAVIMLGEISFADWEAAKDTEGREKALQKTIDNRKKLAEMIGEGENAVLAVDARIAFMQGDAAKARSLATRFNDQTDRRNIPMLLMEAEILLRLNNMGASKDVFTRVNQIDPNNRRALQRMGELEAQLNNWSEAARYLQLSLALDPNNTELQEKVRLARELANGGTSSDPVVKALQEANRIANGVDGNIPAAIEILRKALDQRPGEDKLTSGIAQLMLAQGDRTGALAAIDTALIANPSSDKLKALKKSLDVNDPLGAQLEAINQAPIAEWQKHLARYEAYSRNKKPEEASKELALAGEQAPEDATVVEMRFQDAISRKDMKVATAMAEIAERKNLDQVNGQLFRARLLVLDKKYDDATKVLREVTQKDKLNVLAWRLMGMIQLESGDGVGASDALAKAVEINPRDNVSIKSLIKAMIVNRRLNEALQFARRSEATLGRDPEFGELLLRLESEAPTGDRGRAITIRQNLVKQQPDNKINKIALSEMLIFEKRYAEAKVMIADLRKDPMDPAGVQLDAALRGRQGDDAGAVRVYQDYISAIPEDKRTEVSYIEAARVLNELGKLDAALAFLETGKKYQDVKQLTVEREMGDMLFNAGRFEPSIEAYRTVLEKGSPDESKAVLKRILEAQLRLRKFKELDEQIQNAGAANKDDPTIALLSAESALGQGDRARARKEYDRAITLDPKNPIGFLKRGDFNLGDFTTHKDAEQDYLQVLRLNSRANIARARLAGLYAQMGRSDDAIIQLKDAVGVDSFDDQLRNAYIDLLVERGRGDEAVSAIDEIVKLRPGDPNWLVKGGSLALRVGQSGRAADYFAQVWKTNPTPEVAYYYCTALLSKPTPDIATANEVLSNPSLQTDSSIALRLVRARWYRTQKKTKEASDQVIAALGMVDQTKREQTIAFLSGLDPIYPKPDEVVAALARLEEKQPFKEWMAFQASLTRLRMPENEPVVRKTLESLIQTTQNKSLQGAAYGVLGGVEYTKQNWSAASDYFDRGMKVDPTNSEMLNNYAYVLGTKLNRPQDALPISEQAVKLNPNVSNFLDTLASIHLSLKNYPKAEEYLSQAISLATSDADRGPALLHLAQVRVAQGNKPEGRRLRDLAEQVIRNSPNLSSSYEADLKELRKALDGQ